MNSKRQGTARLRIIGGTWRSRQLPFADYAGVRPTSDRIRETVFNWLQPVISGAHCLDLFAGSGALGFEALSRGAAASCFVDEDLRVIQQLQKNADQLQADGATVVWRNARDYLANHPGTFDIVFLDPPYREDILAQLAEQLEQCHCLADNAWIYVEAPKQRPWPDFPHTWQLTHDRTSGQVRYGLVKRRHKS